MKSARSPARSKASSCLRRQRRAPRLTKALRRQQEESAAQARIAAERERVAAEQAQAIGALAAGLTDLAEKRLDHRIATTLPTAYRRLQDDFNKAVGALATAFAEVSGMTETVTSGTREIAAAAGDLALRTEQQASGLEESAAAVQQITSTVRRTAEGAQRARDVVSTARDDATKGLDRRPPGGRGDGQDRTVVAPDQPDHRRHRRDRLPDQPAGAQRRRRGGARRRLGPRLRRRRLGSARAGAALRQRREGNQGTDFDLGGPGRRRRRTGRSDRIGVGDASSRKSPKSTRSSPRSPSARTNRRRDCSRSAPR